MVRRTLERDLLGEGDCVEGNFLSHKFTVVSQSFYSPGFEEVASEDLEPSEELDQPCFEESVEDALSDEHSEVLDVISSEELDLSEDESSEGCSWGQGGLLSEDLDLVPSEEEASLGDAEELSEEYEELLSEEEHSGPEPEALLVQQ